MKELSVQTLADDPALGLRLLAGAPAAGRVVHGAHTSDLDRPARYLLPGELVLTNGLWLGQVEPAVWTAEVASAGAAGIGFGLSAAAPIVPAALAAACDAHAVPLLEVPEALSFSHIADAVSAAPDPSGLRLQLSRTRRLLQRLGAGGGHGTLLDFLRHETGLRVWLVGPGGRPVVEEAAGPDPEAARRAARASRRGELPCAIGEAASAFGAAPPGTAASAVLVDAPLAAIGDDARLVIEQVAAYVVLEDARLRAGAEGRRGLAAELVELAWSGDLGAAAYAARLRALDLDPAAPVTAMASGNEPADAQYAARACGLPCVTARHRDATLLLAQGGGDDLAEAMAALVGDGGAEPVLGAGRPGTGPSGLRQSVAEAVTALGLAVTRPAGQRVVRHLDIGSHALLLDFVDRQVLRAYRESVVGPIERWDREHDGDLMRTVGAFLQHDGRWRATAAALHIHHNTLRYRLGRVAELTGRDAATTSGRVDFALALAIAAQPGEL